MLSLALLLSCQSGAKITLGGDDGAADIVTPDVSISGPAVADPVLAGPVSYTITRTGGVTVAVEVRDATGASVRVLADGASGLEDVTWDGRDEQGAVATPGLYTVHAELREEGETLASSDTETTIARLGVTDGTLGGERVALCWHHAGGPGQYFDGGDAEITFAIPAIDTDGVVTAIPAPWDGLDEPPADPMGANMPAAFPWDARPTLSLTVGGDTGGAEIVASIEGWTLTSGSVATGSAIVFTADGPLASGPGVVEETLVLTWSTPQGDVVGTQEIPLRMYALLGPPTFEEEGVPYLPWVAVVDPALRAIQGVEPTDEAVLSALVEHIYRDEGLSYDTRYGASAYTQYQGSGFDDAVFSLSGFLARRNGSVVNCTDCASILEAYASMVGAVLAYTIITPSFDLDYIKAIGGSEYTHCPFGSGRCSFNYHAVTTPDDGGTIYDATLALDGDDDPASTPNTELLVQAIDGREYLERLVLAGNPGYAYTQKETIR